MSYIFHNSTQAELEPENASLAETFLTNASITGIDNNSTTSVEDILKIKPIVDIVLLVALVLIMLSMGVEVKKELLLYHIKKPIGISIGMFSQFVALPLSAFSLLQCSTVSGIRATGVLLMSCCPGGVISNIFAYFCDGDLSLSVSMTSLSTLMAMGMMPLNLWMYGRMYETDRILIPYLRLFISLLCVISPAGVGMLLHWKFPRFSSVLTKVGSVVSILLVVIYLIFEATIFPKMFSNIPGSLYGIMLSLPLIGFSLGYTLALLFRQSNQVCKTIAIECSIQNIPLALGIITLSYPVELQGEIIPLPYLYSFSATSCGVLFCCIYRVYRKYGLHKTASKEDHSMKEIVDETGTLKCKEKNNEDEAMIRLNLRDVPA